MPKLFVFNRVTGVVTATQELSTQAAHSRQQAVLLLGLASGEDAAIQGAMRSAGVRVHKAGEGSAADTVALLGELEVDVVVCGRDSQALIQAAARERRVPVIVTGEAHLVGAWLDAIEAGAWDYLVPPLDASHVEAVISSAVRFASRSASQRASA